MNILYIFIYLYTYTIIVNIEWWFEYAWPMGSRTIRRHGLAGVGVALWEEVSHYGSRFEVLCLIST